MDHRVDLVFLENARHPLAVADITLIEFQFLAAQLVDAFERLGTGIVVVIHDDGVIPRLSECDAGVRADKARAACYQNCHCTFLPKYNAFKL